MKSVQTDDNFDARKAATSIFEVMKRMGLDMCNVDGKQHWFVFGSDWTKDNALIHLGNNRMFISVCKDGYSFYSRAAIGGEYSPYSKSYEDFKEDMGHVMFHYGVPDYIMGEKNPEYEKFRQYQE